MLDLILRIIIQGFLSNDGLQFYKRSNTYLITSINISMERLLLSPDKQFDKSFLMLSKQTTTIETTFYTISSVTYPTIWRCHHMFPGRCGVSYCRCGCECEGCASLKEMIHLQWEAIASPERDAASPAGDLLASPDFEICDTTLYNGSM
jgi:hypothetical protein